MNAQLVQATLLLPVVIALGCQGVVSYPHDPSILSTVPSSLQLPLTVERLAILYPKSHNREVMDAYEQLAGATFRLKELRPWLRIVERFDLPLIHGEQRFQMSGAVSDETALQVGRLLGVDSVLLYRIEGPTVRDRVFARMYGGMPPYTVTSKVIRVESAEILYHNVVTVPVVHADNGFPIYSGGSTEDFPLRAALEQGIAQTISDLRHAFASIIN